MRRVSRTSEIVDVADTVLPPPEYKYSLALHSKPHQFAMQVAQSERELDNWRLFPGWPALPKCTTVSQHFRAGKILERREDCGATKNLCGSQSVEKYFSLFTSDHEVPALTAFRVICWGMPSILSFIAN